MRNTLKLKDWNYKVAKSSLRYHFPDDPTIQYTYSNLQNEKIYYFFLQLSLFLIRHNISYHRIQLQGCDRELGRCRCVSLEYRICALSNQNYALDLVPTNIDAPFQSHKKVVSWHWNLKKIVFQFSSFLDIKFDLSYSKFQV